MFNKKARTINSIRNSLTGVFCQIINMLIAFIYRVIFLKILSEAYLGIDGLFTNILGVLSLAELGVGSAIAYRLYKHIKDENVEELSALISFYRKIYLGISIIVLVLGSVVMPFLKYLISDISAVPTDINIYLVYFLFLLQSVLSYLFSYKFILLDADQKNHVLTISNTITLLLKYVFQLIILFITRNFVFTLITSILVHLLVDITMSLYVKKKYREIFKVKKKLDKSVQKQIFKETGALMCHKVGGTIVNSTDNILISAFIGITILGAYSNYSLVITGIVGIMNKLFNSIGASIGNLHVSQKNREEEVFKKLVFLNLLVVSMCSIFYCVLINPFIELVFGSHLVLDIKVVLVISITFYISNSKIINNVYVYNCGLFVRDKIRPLIEAVINLVTSIIFVKLCGLAGIFLGTICGCLATVFWREPYLLYKHEFKSKNLKEYWIMQLISLCLMIGIGSITYYVCSLFPNTFGYFLLKTIISLFLVIALYCICLFKTKYFKYYYNQGINLLKKVFKRKEKINNEK